MILQYSHILTYILLCSQAGFKGFKINVIKGAKMCPEWESVGLSTWIALAQILIEYVIELCFHLCIKNLYGFYHREAIT
jgi:hypothetical protein